MSRKRKQSTSNVLSPQLFLSSVAKLNIVAESKKKSTSPSSSSSSQRLIEEKKGEKVVYSNEAIELLRQCHGQFLSLVSSELASGESRIKSASNKKKKKKRNDVSNNDEEEEEAAVRYIVPSCVVEALENLEFHDIATETQLLMNKNKEDDGAGGYGVGDKKVKCKEKSSCRISKDNSSSNDVFEDSTGKTRRVSAGTAKRKRKRIKNAFKNVAMTAELLREQEKLFALSAAKAKDIKR
jgi:hypothetical protein